MRFTFELNGEAAQLRELRAALESWVGSDAPMLDELLIVTNELASNALTYGHPPLQVSATSNSTSIHIYVTQARVDSLPLPHIASETGSRGRGLLLVDALSHGWGWWSSAKEVAVWAVLALPGNLSQ